MVHVTASAPMIQTFLKAAVKIKKSMAHMAEFVSDQAEREVG